MRPAARGRPGRQTEQNRSAMLHFHCSQRWFRCILTAFCFAGVRFSFIPLRFRFANVRFRFASVRYASLVFVFTSPRFAAVQPGLSGPKSA